MDKDHISFLHFQPTPLFPPRHTSSNKLNQMGFSPAGIGSDRNNFFPAGRPCDYCHAADAIIFCHADSVFTCMACDARLHRPDTADHCRVWMCEVCEQAPAVVNCKADDAALCAACDRDIHSANPLASRHDRTPVVHFYDSAGAAMIKYDSDKLLTANATSYDNVFGADHPVAGNRWFSGTSKVPADNLDMKSLDFFFSDTDQIVDYQIYSDSVVPMQAIQRTPLEAEMTHLQPPENWLKFDLSRSHVSSYSNNYTKATLSNSLSSSSMDVGVVPDGFSLSEISYPLPRKMGPSHVVGRDREARVLRYKEKRKNRKFEKAIRYASRKAYAEARPRIKGRFVKRPTDSETGSSQGDFNVRDALFGVVPSF